ncbi:MAG: hypothetical protein HQL56_13720 [Magnetococcales bacterium]|nr:hypothetical protein [Magnetococcales bacterium]
MIGILDPALFLPRSNEKELQDDIEFVLRACREYSIRLIAFPEYWNRLWDEWGRRLQESKANQPFLVQLQECKQDAPPKPSQSFSIRKVEGFKELFDLSRVPGGTNWQEAMIRAVVRALLTGEEVVILTRRLETRNIHKHSVGESALHEMKPWALSVQMDGHESKEVLCVYHVRNLEEDWTTRFDWRLPGTETKYPFCPPNKWREVDAFRTCESKIAWLDRFGNCWARPNISGGKGGHWDVYIRNITQQEMVGLSPINVAEYDFKESSSGVIDHTPAKKQSRIRDAGWHCPKR